ncbi:MAG TPA: DUF4349 domain-containing protein [Candidatus Limnocylindria bacterium]|jgi:hypothetical protein|nr:DUF4349 domain-containing protein [Candidatus Limnocylindria bacterium]
MFRLRLLLLTAVIGLLVVGCSAAAPASTPAPAAITAAGDLDARDADAPASGNEAPSSAHVPGSDGALIVYTGDLAVEVPDVDAAVSAGEQVVSRLGGYVAGSQVSNAGTSASAYVTYRIPADRWAEALAGLRALAERVIEEAISTEDVTAKVVDLEARIANARTTEAALQAIMARADSIPDVLKVQQELSKVRGDIESMTAQRDHLAQRAAFGTLAVSFNVPVTAQAVAAEGWDIGRELDASLAALVRIGQALASLLVWLAVVGLPVLLPLLVLAWLVRRLHRRWLATRPPAAQADQSGWR